MADVRGYATSVNIGDDSKIRDVAPLFLNKPREFALVALLATAGFQFSKETSQTMGQALKKRQVLNPDAKFEWPVNELMQVVDYVNNAGGYAANATSVVVDNGGRFPDESLVLVVRTGEIMKVTSVSSNTLTVTRGYASTTAAIINNDDELLIMGSAYEPNSVSSDILFTTSDFVYNYTQIFKEPYGADNRTMMTKQYDLPEGMTFYEYQKAKKLVEFLRHINMTLWFGERSRNTSTGETSTRGVVRQIDTNNVLDAGGQLTEYSFDKWLLETVAEYGGNTRYLFAGAKFLNKINSFVKDKVELVSMDLNTYGQMGVLQYKIPGLNVFIVHEPAFDKLTQGADAYTNHAVLLDWDAVTLRFIPQPENSADVVAVDDIQENDRTGRKGEWRADMGIQVAGKAHAILKNAVL